MNTDNLITPINVSGDDLNLIRSLSRLKNNSGYQYIISRYQKDLAELKKSMKKEDREKIDLTTLTAETALKMVLIKETNKFKIEQLEGLLNFIDITIGELKEKYNVSSPDTSGESSSEIY